MTIIDGFPVSAELIAFLKEKSPSKEHDETQFTAHMDYLSQMQDYFCRNLGQINRDDIPIVTQFLEVIVDIKDTFSELTKLLPIIKKEN